MAWDPQFSLGNLIEIVMAVLGIGAAYSKLKSKMESIQEDVKEIKGTYLRTDLDSIRQQLTDERYSRLDERMKSIESVMRKS